MVKILTILALLFTTTMLVSAPYLSALSYTMVSVMQPQYIWFWSFEGIPLFKITAGLSILAWIIQAAKGEINWAVYGSGQYKALALLVLVMHLSNLFSPFNSYFAGTSAEIVLGTMRTIFIMYTVVLGLIQNKKALVTFCYTMLAIAAYYTYWTNKAYFEQDWNMFKGGRFSGLPSGPYRDENAFSILLVILMHFILFGILYFKDKRIKVGLIILIPFLWHALILCASRGALLSAGVSTLFATTIIRSKQLNIILLIAFAGAIIWQGGNLLNRTTATVSKAEHSEEPINPRLASWKVGAKLTQQYPLLGVGPQRFQIASRVNFPGESPHVAHNTLLNFSANTGVIAGFIYLYFFFKSFANFRYVKAHTKPDSIYAYINNASMCGLMGFYVGAIFLDLIIFEPFYFIILLISVNYFQVKNLNKVADKKARSNEI
ncbi:O-antigen ligase family protein [Alteromonas sp. K632G]|jgi:O-antigen ligase|uniref:O-antigen ligase family protein n=1 Tax=Alteromonas sp. K632G TaxID=2820757 RepID=UPI000C0C6ADA|nr:O-antigen ligase family protein [Alteromonas sp. K632G]MBO7922661.1 O-antigen ligase family protein [Alteromonas sp. K632G]PHS59390.1 MAG: polymerase [Alteromonas sp.]